MTDEKDKKDNTGSPDSDASSNILNEEDTNAIIDELENAFLSGTETTSDESASIADLKGAAVLGTASDPSNQAAEPDTPTEILFDDTPAPNEADNSKENGFAELTDDDLDAAEKELEAPAANTLQTEPDVETAPTEVLFDHEPEAPVSDQIPQDKDDTDEKAKLDKDDIADELQYALNTALFDEDGSGTASPDNILEELGITPEKKPGDGQTTKASLDREDMPENIFSMDKAVLDQDGIPEDIFGMDKAVLDQDGIPEDIFGTDKAVLDMEGLPEPEAPAAAAPVADESGLKKAEIPETAAAKTLLQKIINRAKETSLVKAAIIVSAACAILSICLVTIILLVFSGSQQETQEDIFAEPKTATEKPVDDIPLVENYQLETFVIPMNDPEKGTCFFKANFILTFNRVSVEELNHMKRDIRKTVYDLFYNKNPEIVSSKLKQSEQIFRLKNALNLLFQKDAVKSISMVNHKVV